MILPYDLIALSSMSRVRDEVSKVNLHDEKIYYTGEKIFFPQLLEIRAATSFSWPLKDSNQTDSKKYPHQLSLLPISSSNFA